MKDYKSTLEPNKYYHIYNRANGNDKLFLCDANYNFFLKKYNYYISPIADTFAYCLLPNHFHFLVRIKAPEDLQGFKNLEGLNQQFSNLFNSYTKAFNKQNHRKGSLFIPRYNRKEITSESYLRNTLNYIHQNPVSHGYVNCLEDWKYSSYNTFFSNAKTNLHKDEAISWFGDTDNFKIYHDFKRAEHLALEMDLDY